MLKLKNLSGILKCTSIKVKALSITAFKITALSSQNCDLRLVCLVPLLYVSLCSVSLYYFLQSAMIKSALDLKFAK